MKAVIADISPQFLEHRRRVGNDRFDEMWEGVLHMAPAPSRSHQDILTDVLSWLRRYWAHPPARRVNLEVNLTPLGGWPNSYRVPDLVLLGPDCAAIDHDVYFEGAPTVVVEILSPGDETMKKLPFYAELGTPEVWVVDRDTRRPELHVLRDGRYELQSPAADGWLASAATGVRLRAEGGRLALQYGNDESTRRLLPES